MKTALPLGIAVRIAFIAISTIAQKPSTAVIPNPGLGVPKIEGIYQGQWATTKNEKLNGALNCEVKQLYRDHWQGTFWGVWQLVPFKYTVEFGVNPNEQKPRIIGISEKVGKIPVIPVMGTARIEGESYEWTGQLSADEFNIEFTGTRYDGSLRLKRTTDQMPDDLIAAMRGS